MGPVCHPAHQKLIHKGRPLADDAVLPTTGRLKMRLLPTEAYHADGAGLAAIEGAISSLEEQMAKAKGKNEWTDRQGQRQILYAGMSSAPAARAVA